MTEPLISIVMPAWNVAAYVGEAVESVARQSWPRLELIAVDDGSTDDTVARIEAAGTAFGGLHRLRLIRQTNRGASAARNTALGAAEGRLIAFLDADDRWHPDLLAELAALLEYNLDVDLTFPLHRYIDEAGAPLSIESRATAQRYALADLMISNPIHSATGVLARAEAVAQAGRFDETLRSCIDLDFWTRIAMQRPLNIAPVPLVLADYRRRAGQITSDWRRMERGWTRVCEKLNEAGRPLSAPQWREGRGRHCLYWASIAYGNGDYGAARRLVAEMWRLKPGFALRDGHARIRTLASLASLLPTATHDRLRRSFNAARTRLGLDWS